MCASPCWTRWRVGTKRNETLLNIQLQPIQKKRRVLDDDSDTDSDNEMLMKSETNAQTFDSRVGE